MIPTDPAATSDQTETVEPQMIVIHQNEFRCTLIVDDDESSSEILPRAFVPMQGRHRKPSTRDGSCPASSHQP